MIRTNRLPNAYQEVEYIESTGTQYIDTGVYPDNNTDIDITLMPRQSTSSNVFPFSSRSDSAIPNINAYYVNQRLNFEIGPQLITGYYLRVGIDVSLDEKLKISLKNNIVYVNEENKGDYSSYSFTSSTSLLLFACRTSNRVDARMFIGRVYKCQIWESNVMTRDYVPCYRKSDDAIGLYDLVNDQFYVNSGTGTFTKGSDVGQHTVKKIMTKVNSSMKEVQYIKTKVNNNMVKVYDALPSNYQRVEYISSNGGQYIDTGFIPDNNTAVEVKIKASTNTNNGWVFGARQAADTKCFAVILNYGSYSYNRVVRSDYGTSQPIQYDTAINLQNNAITILKDKNVVYINGVQRITHTAQTFTCPVNLYLFKINSANGGNHNSYTTMYYAKIWDNGTLIRHYIPCYRKSDNAIGMYDLVNNTFAEGIGTFTKGENI